MNFVAPNHHHLSYKFNILFNAFRFFYCSVMSIPINPLHFRIAVTCHLSCQQGRLAGDACTAKHQNQTSDPSAKMASSKPKYVKVGSCLSPSAPSPSAHLQHRDLGSCWPGHLWTASQPKHRTLNQRAYYIGVLLCYGWLQGMVKKPPKRMEEL